MSKKNRVNYVGEIYGTRKIVANECTINDFKIIHKTIPKDIKKYRLSECLVCGSKIPVLIKNIQNTPPKNCPFCSRYGKNTVNKRDDYWFCDGDRAVGIIPYKNSTITTVIDSDDYKDVCCLRWRVAKKKNKYYLVSGNKKDGSAVYLHTFILNKNVPDGYEIDHIDGNSLNNRKNNLRIVSRLQNIQNSSVRIDNAIGIRGIVKNGNTYQVDFVFNKKRYYFKEWKTINEAVYCRKFAEEIFGLEIINKNPLATKYLNLTTHESNLIKEYVYKKCHESDGI